MGVFKSRNGLFGRRRNPARNLPVKPRWPPLAPMPVIGLTWVKTADAHRAETQHGWRPNHEVMQWLMERRGDLHCMMEFAQDGSVGFADPDLAMEYRMRWS
jgi:hypothetical protein